MIHRFTTTPTTLHSLNIARVESGTLIITCHILRALKNTPKHWYLCERTCGESFHLWNDCHKINNSLPTRPVTWHSSQHPTGCALTTKQRVNTRESFVSLFTVGTGQSQECSDWVGLMPSYILFQVHTHAAGPVNQTSLGAGQKCVWESKLHVLFSHYKRLTSK